MHASSTRTPSRTARRTLTRTVALAVTAALAVVLPAQQTDASSMQELTVRTTGLPAGTEIGLLRLDRTGSYLGWQESGATDAAGTLTFATVPGTTYSLWAAETALTFPQYLGGASTIDEAARFTTADATHDEMRLDAVAAPLVTGTVTWPAGSAPVYGEASLHTWDPVTSTWVLASYAPLDSLTGTSSDVTIKAPAGIPAALSVRLLRADGEDTTIWLGGGTTAPRDEASATTVTASAGAPVSGLRLVLPDAAAPAPSAPAPPAAPAPSAPAPTAIPAPPATAGSTPPTTAAPLPSAAPAPAPAAARPRAATRVTKVKGKVTVRAVKRGVRISVKAAGVKAPTGKVVVKVGSRSRTYQLRAKNRGTIVVKAAKGRAKVRATYRGNTKVARASTTRTVRVR